MQEGKFMSYLDGKVTIGGLILDAWIFRSAMTLFKEMRLISKIGNYIKSMWRGFYPPEFKFFAVRDAGILEDGSTMIECAFGFKDPTDHLYTLIIGMFQTEHTGKLIIGHDFVKAFRATEEEWEKILIHQSDLR